MKDDLEDRVAALEHLVVLHLATACNSKQIEVMKAVAEDNRAKPSDAKVTVLRPEHHGIPDPIVDRIQALLDRVRWARAR